MNRYQALDFGLCLVAVMLILHTALQSVQAYLCESEAGPPIVVQIVLDSDGEPILSADRFRGKLANIHAQLVATCAVKTPPLLELRFPEDTYLKDARRVFRQLQGAPEIVCPISY